MRIIILILTGVAFITLAGYRSFLATTPEPQLVGPNVISTQDDEGGATISHDQKTIYYTKRSPTTQRSNVIVICSSRQVDGKWDTPTLAPFSGVHRDLNPFMTADGERIYFTSTRPVDDKPKPDPDFWYVERTGETLSPPIHAGNVINSSFFEQSLSVAANGNVYISSARDGRSIDIYVCRWVNGAYLPPENLGDAVNAPGFHEQDVFVAPDESYLLFSCQGRPDGIVPAHGAQYPRSDIYISYFKDGKWTPARNLGPPVNSEADESNPFVSADGKTLYFTSERNFASTQRSGTFSYSELIKALRGPANGLGDIYSIRFEP